MNSVNLDPASSDSVIEAVAKALKRKTLSPLQDSFARQIAADWRAEELPGVSLEALSPRTWPTSGASPKAQAQSGAFGATPQIRLIQAKGLGGQRR